ncbi:MAG: type II toxin-antitoxin system RelE/ParE family toxin [Acidobacteriia bacterium]|nr:type II toxin-antitoxin system RelE/ParE family toxin [Terriglobia bacterium]
MAANLEGGVIKQRVARPGQGKSGGFPTLIVCRAGARAFLMASIHETAEGLPPPA